MIRLRNGVATALILTAIATIQGCTMNEGSQQAAAGGGSSDCASRTLDLRRPPSRADLSMGAGQGSTTVSCDDGFDVTLQLPDAQTSIQARQVSVDSYRTSDPATGDPTTVDVHSTSLDLDSAIDVSRQCASDLGIDPSPLTGWRASVSAQTGVDDVKTPFLEVRSGYLTVQMQVVHQGVSKNNYIHFVLSWGG